MKKAILRVTIPAFCLLLLTILAIAACKSDDSPTFGDIWPPIPEAIVDQIKAQAPGLRSRLNALSGKGVDVAYPLVRLTVLEQFSGFLEDDLEAGVDPDQLQQQADELDRIRRDCDAELHDLEGGNLNPIVPRYRTSTPTINGGAFQALVEWHDGSGKPRETWPVIFSGYGAFETVIGDIELITGYGSHIIQIETGPSQILTAENQVDSDRIAELKAVLDRAATAEVAVNLLLSPHYFPAWAFEKWPDIQKNNAVDEYVKIFVDEGNTNGRQVIRDYLEVMIPEIKNHTALHSLTLANEPSYYNAVGDPAGEGAAYNRTAYNTWLASQYGTLAAVSQAHDTTYDAWDDIPVFYLDDNGGLNPTTGSSVQKADYFRFNDQRFAAFHSWMADIVHQIDPDLPVMVKITDQSWQDFKDGVDPERFTAFSQIAGNDSAKYYTTDIDTTEANDYLTQNIFFDLLRSVGEGKPVFNSESHLIEDDQTAVIPDSHIRNVLWQGAVHGQSASVTWVWEREVLDESTGRTTRASIMNRPANVVAHGRTALDLLRLGKEINALQSAAARTAIIYSATTLRYNDDYVSTLVRTYEALNATGEKIDFITETGLADGDAAGYAMVLAPGVTHLPAAAYQGLTASPPGEKLVLIGSANFARDHLNQDYSYTLPDSAITLSDTGTARIIRDALLPLLESLSGGRPIKVINSADGEEAFGLEWRTTVYDGRRLVNLTNYNRNAMTVTVEGLATTGRTDLISGGAIAGTFTISPLQVYLLSAAE